MAQRDTLHGEIRSIFHPSKSEREDNRQIDQEKGLHLYTMYSLGQLKRGFKQGIQSPNIFLRELNRIYYTQKYGPGYNHNGVDIVKEDWDTLVILDACRYDLFSNQNIVPGRLEQRISRGSHTSDFLRGNFSGKRLFDTVYTTATPQLERYYDEINVKFHSVNNIWSGNQWNANIGTVLPEDMTKSGLEAINQFPEKRHIIHYLQPHYPFIESDIDNESLGVLESNKDGFDFWQELFRGQLHVPEQEIWQAYRQNFNIVIEAVQDLIDEITGKTVITSDHGNMIAERASPIPIREWGHPSGVYTPELVTVPWLIHDSNDRREIQSEPPTEAAETVQNSVVKDRLKDLGYI